LDAPDIFDGHRRQLGPGARAARRCAPALHRLINRLDPRLVVCVGWQMVERAIAETVAHTDLDAIEAVKHVQFGQCDAVNSADRDGLPDQYRIKPAAAPFAPCDGTEFRAGLSDAFADLVLQLCRKWSFADPGGVGFCDPQDKADVPRT